MDDLQLGIWLSTLSSQESASAVSSDMIIPEAEDCGLPSVQATCVIASDSIIENKKVKRIID